MTLTPIPALCEACAQLGVLTQSAKPHDALMHEGYAPSKLDNALEQRFRCSNCDTVWLRPVDRWGSCGTFRLAPNVRFKK